METTRFIARSAETKISFIIFALVAVLITSFLYGVIQDGLSSDLANSNFSSGRHGLTKAVQSNFLPSNQF